MFSHATGTFGKNLARIARESDEPGKQRISIFKFIFYNLLFCIIVYKIIISISKLDINC